MSKQYGDDQIDVLEGLEAVRVRPGMYIGSTSSRGLHHLVWEIVDNSVDEHLAGFGSEIDVFIHDDDSMTVVDRGRGIPAGMHKTGKPTIEVVLTVLHAGGKFGGKDSGYNTSGGLHGVGSSCVNALSEKLIATVRRDGKIHQIGFSQGKTVSELKEIGTCDENETGTTITWKPDPEIFRETTVYDAKIIGNRLREIAMLNPKLTITLTDERVTNEETGEFMTTTFHYENGIRDFVAYVNRSKKPLHQEIFHVSETIEHMMNTKEGDKLFTYGVDVSFQYCEDSYSANDGIFSYTNNIRTPDGGMHEAGFKTAITSVLKEYITSRELLKKSKDLKDVKELPNGDDMRTGITAIISVKVPNPEFEGQTKGKLGNSEVRGVVDGVVQKAFIRFLEEQPQAAEKIASKIVDSFAERMAARNARLARRKNKKDDSGFGQTAKKLADCSSKDPNERELFIVEGDSAGGSAKQGRDRKFQAILPLRGKVINCEKHSEDKVFANNEAQEIQRALRTGFGEEYDHSKLSYNKVIIMTDADVDGSHIAILLLTYFYRYMKELLLDGKIYLAKPPLYRIETGKKNVKYVYTDRDKDAYLATLPETAKPMIQRYKGLGEMDPEQLWDTTMDPSVRLLDQITVDDAMEAEMIFRMLMGDDTDPRKEFIRDYAHLANLDI